MTAKKIKLTHWECECNKCGAKWVSRTSDLPTICSVCKSPRWNREQKKEKKR